MLIPAVVPPVRCHVCTECLSDGVACFDRRPPIVYDTGEHSRLVVGENHLEDITGIGIGEALIQAAQFLTL